jgi:hypothetical protein
MNYDNCSGVDARNSSAPQRRFGWPPVRSETKTKHQSPFSISMVNNVIVSGYGLERLNLKMGDVVSITMTVTMS